MSAARQAVIVIGGTRGIGAAIVRRLVATGYHAVFSYQSDAARAAALRDELGADACEAFVLDLADGPAAREAIKPVLARFDGVLHGIVMNAGIARDGFLAMLQDEDWERVVNVNFKNHFYVLQLALKCLIRGRRGGSVVSVSSISAERCPAGQANYASSKAAQVAMCRTLAREVGRYGIRVNSVSPGFVETAMTAGMSPELVAAMKKNVPLGRFGLASEVAEAVEFLMSPRASYITGSDLVVDGGLS
jgi:3-oxoacyl-[acyl-carrier protein] reductase